MLGGKEVIHNSLSQQILQQVADAELLPEDEEDMEDLLDDIEFTAVLERRGCCSDHLRITATLELI